MIPASTSTPAARPPAPARGARRAQVLGAAIAAIVALVPFAQGLAGTRVFYIRDLSLFFWGRYLFLRRAWLSGEWPLWDPFVGGGQAAYSDALHQMFLPPAVAVRLLGGEVFGFNLWVAIPFPLTAIGAFGFFARRFSVPASTLGAAAFTLCGPVISGGNFPNMSWSVAAIPWVAWAADLVASGPTPRRLAALAVAAAVQCLAGEPVTVFTTVALVVAYTLTFADSSSPIASLQIRARRLAVVLGALALGAALAAVQLVPMMHAARAADRAGVIVPDTWSLRPTALLETVWLHLFGNYYEAQSLTEIPWMPLMYTDREPFFFSIYVGVPLLALAAFGFAGTAPRRWRLFWATAGFIALLGSFGSYTPVYPILRDHVPPFGSFRFPVKYIVVTALAIAAAAAAGWDTLAGRFQADPRLVDDVRRRARARLVSIGAAVLIGALAALFAASCLLAPATIRGPLDSLARAFGDGTGDAADVLIASVPGSSASVIVPAFAAAMLIWAGTGRARWAALARPVLFLLIAGDLLVKAAGINPAFDPQYVQEPAWLAHAKADPDARFYVGGKVGATLVALDVDAPRGYLNAPGLTGSASRAALSIQGAFYPSAWRGREMLSYDLPVLWPKPYADAAKAFFESTKEKRDLFLDRTGVRYRILPEWRGGDRPELEAIPQFNGSFLYDWAPVAARASIVGDVRVVPEFEDQIEAMFDDGWDSSRLALVEREPPAAGKPGRPVTPFARFVEDRPNRVVIEAGTGAGGGYLVVLDSYADDWQVTVDGLEAAMVRANALFRAVRLTEGPHTIEFDYRPRALYWGGGVSAMALACLMVLLTRRRAEARAHAPGAEPRPITPAPSAS